VYKHVLLANSLLMDNVTPVVLDALVVLIVKHVLSAALHYYFKALNARLPAKQDTMLTQLMEYAINAQRDVVYVLVLLLVLHAI